MFGHYRRQVVTTYDYNVATHGSFVGTWAGSNQLTSPRVAPLNDTIKLLVMGLQEVTMAELAGTHSGLVKTLKGAFVKNHD